MIGREMLVAVGMPAAGFAALAARCDVVDVSMCSEAQLVRMCGNAMHLPCVGAAMLYAALCIEPLV